MTMKTKTNQAETIGNRRDGIQTANRGNKGTMYLVVSQTMIDVGGILEEKVDISLNMSNTTRHWNSTSENHFDFFV